MSLHPDPHPDAERLLALAFRMAGGDRGEAEHLAVTIAALIRAGDMTVEQVDGGLRLTVADWPGEVVASS